MPKFEIVNGMMTQVFSLKEPKDPHPDWTQAAIGRVEHFLSEGKPEEAQSEWEEILLERLTASGEKSFANHMVLLRKKIHSSNPA